jgi:tetratricopeptide (TPR) repeat protein
MSPEQSRHNLHASASPSSLDQDSELTFSQIRYCVNNMQFVDAEKLAKTLVERVETECAPDHPLRRRALVELSHVLARLEDYEKADEALIKAIQLAAVHGQASGGEGDLNELRMIRADLMHDLGRTEEAIALSALVLDDTEHSVPQRAASYIILAQAHMAVGRIQEYSSFMQLAYAAAQSAPREFAGELVAIFVEGGNREVQAGRFLAAAGLFQLAIAHMRESFDEDVERIARLEMYVAEQYDRAGMFSEADRARARVLREMSNKLGKDAMLVMDIREELALGMVGHSGGRFEYAEQMLVENVEIAQESLDPDLLMRTQLALSKAYSSRGMYADTLKILREAHQQLSEDVDPEVRIRVLREFGGCLAECGAAEEAEMLFRQAVEEARFLPGPDGIVTEVSVLSSLAGIIATKDPEEARSVMQKCRDLLDELPPSYEPVSRLDLNLVSHGINDDSAGPHAVEADATLRLASLQQEYGESFPFERASLMVQKAGAPMKAYDLNGAREELEEAKSLLERRALTQTSLFGMVLSMLSETLPPGDPMVLEYHQQVDEIMGRVNQARAELDNWGREDSADQ